MLPDTFPFKLAILSGQQGSQLTDPAGQYGSFNPVVTAMG